MTFVADFVSFVAFVSFGPERAFNRQLDMCVDAMVSIPRPFVRRGSEDIPREGRGSMKATFSKTRLARMHERMMAHVERGYVPGIVTLVNRRGETHVHAVGSKTLDRSDPMRRDTIFRITSMTKPVTAVAAMILVEECALRLDESIERLLPELANRRVLKSLESPLDDSE